MRAPKPTLPPASNYNLLRRAIINGQTDTALDLLERYPTLSTNPASLHRAISHNRNRIVSKLLDQGADPNAVNETDEFDRTPLELAISVRNTLIIHNLIEKGAVITHALRAMAADRDISLPLNEAAISSLWAPNPAENSSNEESSDENSDEESSDEEIINRPGR